ncbi:WRKY transcription factor 55 [Carex littledalei]|uniref:WRKY transcription factor 55 n=1 Tax=Carex littledalei TaxID=544730 RepID=A0A833QYV0_9POAL|nr:WRKY transcription factor 55 [Carex littledalei]
MENSYVDQEAAIKEVGRGYDILKQLQGLLQLKSRNGEELVHKQELAEPLFREALQALNYALCIMRSGVGQVGVKSEIVVIESGSPAYSSHESVASYDSNQRIEKGRVKRRRVEENSWINNTSMPYDDGYQWRKYGDKKISGTDFSRSYFRCTYKEEYKCTAKKVVQQTSDGDTPSFRVTYTNKHTCNFRKTISPPTSQSSSFGSIEQDSGINQMPDIMPQQLNQSSCLVDANNLEKIYANASMVERNCEWDIESFLMDW